LSTSGTFSLLTIASICATPAADMLLSGSRFR
jgi:hypothetical protein